MLKGFKEDYDLLSIQSEKRAYSKRDMGWVVNSEHTLSIHSYFGEFILRCVILVVDFEAY